MIAKAWLFLYNTAVETEFFKFGQSSSLFLLAEAGFVILNLFLNFEKKMNLVIL